MRFKFSFRLLGVPWLACFAGVCLLGPIHNRTCLSQIFDERFDDWPVDLKIAGTLVIADEDEMSADRLRNLIGNTSDQAIDVLSTDALPQSLEFTFKESFSEVRPLTVVDFAAGSQNDFIAWHIELSTAEKSRSELEFLERQMRAHLQAGKTLIVTGSHRRIVSNRYIAAIQHNHPTASVGLNLLPDCVLATDAPNTKALRSPILSVLASFPRCVGISVDDKTSLVLRGRKIRVVGDGQAAFLLTANEHQAIRSHVINQQSLDLKPNDWMVDLTQWRREAIDRTLEPFPPELPRPPFVENGTLMIVGGGNLPEGLMDLFLEKAGGREHAKLVYVPCSEDEEVSQNSGMISTWRSMGVRDMSLLHTKDRVRADQDQDFLAPLHEATGIWFGGGRQWNFADSYYGTSAHRLMKDVLHRGGIIGGSSAGASIQGRYLARATPIENFEIMAPGYERGGLGFLEGVAIDQHFTQRGRQPDMTRLVNRYPQLLGIGIDESTALVVNQSNATVFGAGKVHFYDRRQAVHPERPDHISLADGQSYELIKRQVVERP